MVRFRIAWWFKNIRKGSEDPISIILLDVAERCVVRKKVKLHKVGDWIPPAPDVLKFNVDGSVQGPLGQAGIGGVLRDSKGKVLCIFSEKAGSQDIISAEILAIARACNLSASNPELRNKSIVVVSDSKTAVSWINGSGVGSWVHVHQILEIRNLLGCMSKAHVEYESRVTNSFADLLAKKVAAGDDDVVEWSLD